MTELLDARSAAIGCEGCDQTFESVEAFALHVKEPTGFCWRAVEAYVSEWVWAHRASRTNLEYATHKIMTMMRAVHAIGKEEEAPS